MKRSRRAKTRRSRGRVGPAQVFAQHEGPSLFGQDFIEGSAQDHDDVRRLVLLGPHEIAARQQELLGYTTQARRIRECGHPNNPTSRYPGRRCGLRSCPSCAKVIAVRNGKKMAEAVRRMSNPTVTLFSLIVPWSLTAALDLGSAMSDFREAHREMRRLDCFAGIKGGIGAIETKVIEGGGGFNLHAHVIIDLVDIDEAEINATWQALIQRAREKRVRSRGRGRRSHARWRRLRYSGGFSICSDKVPRDTAALCIYSTKSTTWSPVPGTVKLPQLRAIQRAIWRRHLVLKWGSALPPKPSF